MAHLWINASADAWEAVPLAGDTLEFSDDLRQPPRAPAGGARRVGMTLLRRRGSNDWLLMARPDSSASVNGEPLAALGVRLLADKDEIRVTGTAAVFFSIDEPARIEPFPGSERSIICPRCQRPVTKGQSAVICPHCRVWHHQSQEENMPCWTYAPHCTLCDQATELDGRYRWTPEEL